ncbi:M81 family metallopeptidase [Paenibacillus marinisediminis]
MNIAVVGMVHETNTFAPGRTDLHAFQSEWVEGNDDFLSHYAGTRTSMGGVIDAALAYGLELSVGFYTTTTPSGMISSETAQALIQHAVESVDEAADGLLVILHGAMVAEGITDMEGELLRRIRTKAGKQKPIACTLDLHANISLDMVELSDILVGYDTYPHVDVYERAVEAVQLLVRRIRGEIAPVRAYSRPNMLVVPQMMITEEPGPMQEMMERAHAIERERSVLNVTIAGGFPYSDVPEAGVSVVVTTDGDQELAERYAEQLSQMFWERRERFEYTAFDPRTAVAMAFAEPKGPVILVEGSDNVGGGAPADATHVLCQLINPPKKSLIVIRDEAAVRAAHLLGVGGRFQERIGGKCDALHGPPVEVSGRVKLLSDGEYTHIGAYMTGQRAYMGKTAVIEADNLTVVLTELRTPPWDPGHLSSIGIRAQYYHTIVVKAAIAWKTAFGSICKAIIPVDSPGCCGSNLSALSYEQLSRPIFPFDQ